jgi:hypothetical protein
MDPIVQRLFAWSAVPWAALFLIGLVIAGWVPPPPPADSAATTARYYADHRDAIRVACVLIGLAATLCLPFAIAISIQIKESEARLAPFAYAQFGFAVVVCVTFMVPTFFWMTAAFYPVQDADIIRVLNAGGWLPFMCAVFPALFQNLAIAGAIFSSKRPEPVFPRWVGYVNLWVALSFLPAGFVMFFHEGPLAWNGILTWWLAASLFCVWLVVMLWAVLRAIARQQDASVSGQPALTP